MAKVIGKSHRGRPQSSLRRFVVENAPRIAPSTADKEMTIVVGKLKNGRPDDFKEKFPNNAVFIPAEMLVGKSQATAYEIARLGRKESGKEFTIETCKYQANDGAEGFIMYLFIDNRPKEQEPKKIAKKAPTRRTKK